MYGAVDDVREKERRRKESDKGSTGCETEKQRESESGKQHRDTGYKRTGVSLAAVSTPRNANEPPHPAKRIKE
jgi:hypothetical protein